jgi:hypothetical protein
MSWLPNSGSDIATGFAIETNSFVAGDFMEMR